MATNVGGSYRSKIQQKATLILMDEVERLRSAPVDTIVAQSVELKTPQHPAAYKVLLNITEHTPFYGTFQFKIMVKHRDNVIVETLFYRSAD